MAAQPPPPPLKVSVCGPWVGRHEYPVPPDTTVGKLKDIVAFQKGIPVEELHLFVGDGPGAALPDSHLLCRLNDPVPSLRLKRVLTAEQLLDVYSALVCCQAVYHENPLTFLSKAFITGVPIETVSALERCVNGKTHYLTATRVNKKDQVIVAFRGSAGWDDAVDDAKIVQALFHAAVGGVHHGFQGRANEVDADALKDFAAHLNRGMSLVFTGHSLGAAIACLTACNLVTTYPEHANRWIQSGLLSVIGFGSPLICDIDFVTNNLGKLKERCLFVVNDKDVVPRLLSACSGDQMQELHRELGSYRSLMINAAEAVVPSAAWSFVPQRLQGFLGSTVLSVIRRYAMTIVPPLLRKVVPWYTPFGMVMKLHPIPQDSAEVKPYTTAEIESIFTEGTLNVTSDSIKQHFANEYYKNLLALKDHLSVIAATTPTAKVKQSHALHGHPATWFNPQQVIDAAALLYVLTGHASIRELLQSVADHLTTDDFRTRNATIFARLLQPGTDDVFERARSAAAVRPREFWKSKLLWLDGAAELLQTAVGMNNGIHPQHGQDPLPEYVSVDEWLSRVDDQLYAVRLLRWAIESHNAKPTVEQLRSIVNDPTAFAYAEHRFTDRFFDLFRRQKRSPTIADLIPSNVERPPREALQARFGRRSREDTYLLTYCDYCNSLRAGNEADLSRFDHRAEVLVLPKNLLEADLKGTVLQLFEQIRPFSWNVGISFSATCWPLSVYINFQWLRVLSVAITFCAAYYYGLISHSMFGPLSWEVWWLFVVLAVAAYVIAVWFPHSSVLPYRDYVGSVAPGKQGSLVHVEKSVKGLPLVKALADLRAVLCTWYTVAVCGKQGVGKSTLCECLTGDRFRPQQTEEIAQRTHDIGWATVTRDQQGRKLQATFIDLPGLMGRDSGDALKHAVAQCACVRIVVVDITSIKFAGDGQTLLPNQDWMSILEIKTPAHVVVLLNMVDRLPVDTIEAEAKKRRDAVVASFSVAQCYLTSLTVNLAHVNRIPMSFRAPPFAAAARPDVHKVYLTDTVKQLIQTALLDVDVSAAVLY